MSAGIDKLQLSERVAGHVREAIMVGELRSTEYLRTEHLASQLGVSATPVREALMILHSEGTLQWEPRRGFRVIPLHQEDIRDQFAVQAHLAGELAARSATILRDEDVERLHALQQQLRDNASRADVTAVDRLNHEFHRTINRAPQAHRLASMLRTTVRYVPLNYYARVSGWADASVDDHVAILDALRLREPEPTRRAMEQHVVNIGELLLQHLIRQGAIPGESPDKG